MLTFLRKIRRTLIDSGSAGKYLAYAVGEIALVVIGILIALNINNSNEYKNDRAVENVYLEGLLEELLRDSVFFEETDKRLGIIEESGRNVINIIENPGQLVSDSLKFLNDVRYMIGLDQKLPEPIIWKELQSSGNLRLIRNRKLLELLYKHYHNVRSCQKDYDDNAHPYILKGRYFDSKTFTVSDQDDFFDNWKKDFISTPEVFNEFLNNKEFYFISKGIVTGMLISRRRLLNVRNNIKKPLKELRTELNK